MPLTAVYAVDPVVLADGRPLVPGQRHRIDLTDPHNRALADAGRVLVEHQPQESRARRKPTEKEDGQ